MPDPRRYDDQDVQAIIQRALEDGRGANGDLTHADLLGIGEQVGVSPDVIERAALEVSEARRASQATRRIQAQRRRWLAAHAVVFALINALLFSVNALTTPGEWWFLFSAVFWGLALGGHAAFALGAGVSSKRLQRERARIEAETRGQTRPQLRVSEAEPATEVAEERPEPEANRSARS
jgi:hypothetical protein